MSTTSSTGPPQPPPRNVLQDVAPKGGYAPINVARNVSKSIGTAGAAWLLIGTGAMMAYGFYRVGTFNVKPRMLKEEKKHIRRAITPLLQAEEDARFVKARDEYHKWEADIMLLLGRTYRDGRLARTYIRRGHLCRLPPQHPLMRILNFLSLH